jgi:hypothetical protein
MTMRHAWMRAGGHAAVLFVALLALRVHAADVHLSFEDVPPGDLPLGWVVAATHPTERMAEWQVTRDDRAPDGRSVLALTEPGATRGFLARTLLGSVYNLCWTRGIAFGDGIIEVAVRADGGEIDQGGGPIWRVGNADNYYLARYNPLERNFRLYSVKDGERHTLADAGGLTIGGGEWFTIRIVQQGGHIEAWLNGTRLLTADDNTLPDPGGVGMWTKADAVTAFDAFSVSTAD